MSRFRDVQSVSVFGNSFTGVQEVNLSLDAENFMFSGDDDVFIKRVDVTKQTVGISIIVQDPEFLRDIKDPKLGVTDLNEVVRFAFNENAEEIQDSSEYDQWRTYIGITRRKVEANLELHDINQILTEGTLKIGDMGTLQFDALPGAATSGLADQTAWERYSVANCVCTGINPIARHGEVNNGTVDFIGAGDSEGDDGKIVIARSDSGSSAFDVHCGDSGTISFIAPSIAGSGGNFTVSIANCVCLKCEFIGVHAGRLERRFEFRAYSSDGQTTPITLS